MFRKSHFASYFVGTARLDLGKGTVKEHHTSFYSEDDAAEEIHLLAQLSHDCIPQVFEVFVTNIGIFTVRFTLIL